MWIQIEMTWKELLRAHNMRSCNSVKEISLAQWSSCYNNIPTQCNHLSSTELTSMQSQILPWEEDLPEAAPEQHFLYTGCVTAMSICLRRQPFFHLQTTRASHSVSGILWLFLFIQKRVNEMADSIISFFLPLVITLLAIHQGCLPSVLQVFIWLSGLLLPMWLAFG